MDATTITERKREFIQRFGRWTAHCIHLGHNIYTFDEPSEDSRLNRIVQVVADTTGQPLKSLSVVDLACLEGQFAIEFALQGSRVLAIEGREVNLAKVKFVREILSLSNLETALDDVRNLRPDLHGTFDVVLCLGILYHLDAPDVMEFLGRIYQVCNRVAIIDTHISLKCTSSYDWNGKRYWGTPVQEHPGEAKADQKEAMLWKSLGNEQSFWLTKPSLYNLLRHVGFSSVFKCINPHEQYSAKWPMASSERVVWKNRQTLIAIKGKRHAVLSSPVADRAGEIDRPEKERYIKTGQYSAKRIRGYENPGV